MINVIVGLLVGCAMGGLLSGIFSVQQGFPLLRNVCIAALGGVLAGWILIPLLTNQGDFFGMVVVASLGAAVLLGAADLIKNS